MIILTSSGFNSQLILDETKKHITAKHRKATMITTASDFKNNDWHIPRLISELSHMGLEAECIDIEFIDDVDRLYQSDFILLIGGNPFRLLKYLKKYKLIFENMLRQNKIIAGISAGSLVLGTTIELINEFEPQMNDSVGLQDLSGLCLSTIDICPHVSRFVNRYDSFLERVSKFEESKGIELYRINDGEGIFILGNEIYKV